MGHELDRSLELTSLAPGEFALDLDGGWAIGAGLNGGFLLAVIANALRSSLDGKPDPLVISAFYLSASAAGPAQVSTRVVRDGGSIATVAAELSQGGVPRITALATYGDLAALPDEVETTAEEPVLTPLDQCLPASLGTDVPPLLGRWDMRLDPDTAGFAIGRPTGSSHIQSWLRLADGREPDALSVLAALDALPPVTFELGRPGWAPTLEITAHVRANPAPGWLKVRHETRNIAGGMFEEDCEVWDSAGRLVGQSRQLARLPRPPAG